MKTARNLFSLVLVFIFLLQSDLLSTENPELREGSPVDKAKMEFMKLRNPQTNQIPDNIRLKELKFSERIPDKESLSIKNSDRIMSGQWIPAGPFNIGGRTRALAIDRNNSNIILAGNVAGGMWRSVDAGNSWTRVFSPGQPPNVTCIAQDPRPGQNNVWYCGTGEMTGGNMVAGSGVNEYQGWGILKSTDNGMTWASLPSTLSGSPVDQEYFDFVHNIVVGDDGVVYAALKGIIVESYDGGNQWFLATEDLQGNQSAYTDVAKGPDGTIYASLGHTSEYGEFVSLFGGMYAKFPGDDEWYLLSDPQLGFPQMAIHRCVIAPAPSNANIVYFLMQTLDWGISNGQEVHALLALYYDGNTYQWANLSDVLPVEEGSLKTFQSQLSYDLTIAVKPDNEYHVFFGGTNLYRFDARFLNPADWIGGYNPEYDLNSNDYMTWKNMTYPGSGWDFHRIVFDRNNPRVMYTASDHGISRTNDCIANKVAWQEKNRGYHSTHFYCIAINESVPGDRRIIGGKQDNGTNGTSGGNADWNWLGGGDGSFCAIPDDNSRYFISSQYANIFRAFAGNDMEAFKLEKVRQDTLQNLFIAPFLLDPNDNKIMYSPSTDRIMMNRNVNGANPIESWEVLAYFTDGTVISTIAVSKNPANRVYFASTNGRLFMIDDASAQEYNIYELTGSNFPQGGYLECIAVDEQDANHIIAAFSNYGVPSLFATYDSGNTWMDISGNFEEFPNGAGDGPSCRYVEILNRGGKRVYFVGTSVGLYSTTALNGFNTTWLQEGANSIGKVMVQMIKARNSDGFVAVGTHANGVFTSDYATSVETAAKPQVVYLNQNYPNPFKNTSIIDYTVANDGITTLNIYDAAGKIVSTPVNEYKASGYYSIELSAEGLESGAYFYRLENDGQQWTRKLTVMK